MPILYEGTFGKKQKFAPVTDQQMTVTITMAAGKGTIVSAFAFDSTGTTISKAYPGQGIGLQVNVKNAGGTDVIWIDIKDKDTGQVLVRTDGIRCATSVTLNGGATWSWTAAAWVNGVPNLTMPNKTWNLLFEAGHGT